MAVHDETSRTKTLRLRLDAPSGHQAGQHYVVRLTAPDGYTASRSYSVSSAPDGSAELELTAGAPKTELFTWPQVEGDRNIHGPLAFAIPAAVRGYAAAVERLLGYQIGTRPALLAGVLFVMIGVQLVVLGLLAELSVHLLRRIDPDAGGRVESSRDS